MCNLLAVTVHAANIHDTKSGIRPAKQAFEKYPTIKKFCGDEGYRKSFEEAVMTELGVGVDVSAQIKPDREVIPQKVGCRAYFQLAWTFPKTFKRLRNQDLSR